ncbi:MAG TPA: AzlC family ABC transporter permease [Methylomirabilota bacterium]|nr:AzlC family ABC transporter permease [Methylomirabilota bacterium]
MTGEARRELRAGVRDAATTVVPSVLAYGAVWGGLARQAGLSLGEAVAMCLLVSAGTAQFVALPMLAAQAPAWLLVVTAYVVNLRHYLMAASLAPFFAGLPKRKLALLAHLVTDEPYALAQARYAAVPAEGAPARAAYYVGCAGATYLAWYAGAASGAWLGSLIPDPRRFGLDFVFPAVFLAILAREIRSGWQWAVAAAAVALALGVARGLGGTWHIAIAGLGASFLGLWLAPRDPGPSPAAGFRRTP